MVPIYGRSIDDDADLHLFSWFYPSDSTGFKDLFGCGGFKNYTGYCQRLVTADLDQADRTSTPTSRPAS